LLRVGGTAVGLVGLEAALEHVERSHRGGDVPADTAAGEVLALIEERNYVPPAAREVYRTALRQLWLRRRGLGHPEEPRTLSIRILGPGCVTCMQMERIVRSVLDQRGIAADIEHVRDLDEIWRYGVMQTPAMVINDEVLCAGRLPSRAQVETWVQERFAR